MLPLAELFLAVVSALIEGLVGWIAEPSLIYFPIMIVIVMSIVHRQNLRQVRLEQNLFGVPFTQPLRQTFISLGLGMLGGLLASMLMISLGIVLSEEMGIIYVWPVVLLLMLISPRFMCFAYGGGVVGAISLLLRLLVNFFPDIAEIGLVAGLMAIDIPALMALVAVLHLTESFLIFISGHNASPVVVKSTEGKVVGGFMLQRFWPMPMIALLAVAVNPVDIGGGTIAMPDWWPLLRPVLELESGQVTLFMMLPVIAALGYSDLAIASTPRQKSLWSARNLLLYSLVLLGLALMAGKWPAWQVLPVLFAPLGHELLIQLGNRREWSRQPVFDTLSPGLKLLTVLPRSPAQLAGLDTGWTIINVNGYPVNSRRDLASALASFPGLAEVDVTSPTGEQRTLRLHQQQGQFGFVPAPDGTGSRPFVKLATQGFLMRKWQKWKNNKSDT